MSVKSNTVNTVLGPVPTEELGVVAVHEALLSVVPGAEYAFDVTLDRAEIFETLAAKLTDFRRHGGGTIVDSTGMFHGRDVRMYEALSRATGVHIVASTGQGPEELLGGYFLTPQTNPPTPWPAEKFADLFTREITEGMVVPRVERRGAAGLVATVATRDGMTATDESLFRGAARTALATGVAVSLRFGGDALHDLGVVLDERLPADRVVVGGLDRRDAVAAGAPQEIASRGAYVALDHVGTEDEDHLTDAERAALVADLVRAGFGDRVLLSSSATGVAKGHPADAAEDGRTHDSRTHDSRTHDGRTHDGRTHDGRTDAAKNSRTEPADGRAAGAAATRPGNDLPYSYVLTTFVPLLAAQGLGDEDVRRILVENPRDLLSVR